MHALLNLARTDLLEHGEDAVRALIPRIEGAAVADQDLKIWEPNRGARLANPQSRLLEQRLRERRSPGEEGRPPYFTLQELLPPGLVQRWRTLPARKVEAGMTADLLALPSRLSLIPSHLGFDVPEFVRLLTILLLRADQTSSEGVGPAHTGSPHAGSPIPATQPPPKPPGGTR
ncbi:hypothetical protein [Deinococcus sp.]|uniref:hypothetical protein n=1 Tax=Deinococcus sp. TaxID=47478 RepID=UPI003C7E4D5F